LACISEKASRLGIENDMESTARPTSISAIGDAVEHALIGIGSIVQFTGSMFLWLLSQRPCHKTVIPTFFQVGVRSVPVVAITGMFIGMVLAVQAYDAFKLMKVESQLGPVLAATMMAGRIGGAMAAEIGTMKVTEQIDALRCLGTNPIHYLVVPRFMACVVLIPLLTVIADFMGIMAGALVSTTVLRIDSFYYWQHSSSMVGPWEIFTGLCKSLVFGAEIAVISCYRGFQSGAGAEGVGRSATQAFVQSFIAILATDFLLAIFFNNLYLWIWPGEELIDI
jgi:phospholipid/cholesterol/gamma-HCH transport system permease protein